MSAVYVGELSVGAAVPGAAASCDAGIAGIAGALPDIEARLEALASFSPAPFDFASQLALAEATLASVQLAIETALPAPSIDTQIANVLALAAQLHAQVAAINAQLSIVVGVKNLLATGGVFAFHLANTAAGIGADLTSALTGGVPGGAPTDACNALVLVAASGATWDAMSAMFKVTP